MAAARCASRQTAERKPVAGSACRFGLLHGEGKLSSSSPDAPAARFSFGREIAAGEAGAALAQKLSLAYQAAEKALTP
jgi:hypothetical protein